MLSKRRRNSSFKVPLPPENRAKCCSGTDSQGPDVQKIEPPVSNSSCVEPESGASQFAQDKEPTAADNVLPEKESAHILLQVKAPPELDVLLWYKDLLQSSQSIVLSPEQLQALTQAQSQKVAKVDGATADLTEDESTCSGEENKKEVVNTSSGSEAGDQAIPSDNACRDGKLHKAGGLAVEADAGNAAPELGNSTTVEATTKMCEEGQECDTINKPVSGELLSGEGGAAPEVAAPSQEDTRGKTNAITNTFDLKKNVSAAVPDAQGLAELPESISSFSAQGIMQDTIAIEKGSEIVGTTALYHTSWEAGQDNPQDAKECSHPPMDVSTVKCTDCAKQINDGCLPCPGKKSSDGPAKCAECREQPAKKRRKMVPIKERRRFPTM
ncbi:hypothetical protein CLOM_g2254 [Closterium sp. NIES-68]|nr:hypothetical protein CLOM_g2254 [Closterium sp. NIES-68]